MYVCVCLAVSDKDVREAIESGATSRHAVTRACGAGGDCGACHGMIDDMIEDHLEGCAECPAAKHLCPEGDPVLVPDSALVRKVA